jgi:hypothetical protein
MNKAKCDCEKFQVCKLCAEIEQSENDIKKENMKALCIDPGTVESGYVIYDGEKVITSKSGIQNKVLLEQILNSISNDVLIIEMISSYGMAVGKSTFETCVWIGRFLQAFGEERTFMIYRKDVKMHLCNTMRAKDSNIRQAVLDKFPANGGGKTPQIGTKNQPGPLYGVTGHAMSALALGITYFETQKGAS